MRTGRRTHAIRASLVAVAATATFVAANPQGYATPETPEPTVDTAQERVDELYHQAEQAAERFNELRTVLKDARQQLSALESDVESQQDLVDELSDEVGDVVAAQAQGTPGGTTSQLLSSGDADAFLSGVAAMQAYGVKQTNLLDTLDAQTAELELRVAQMEEQVEAIEQAKDDMAAERAEIDDKFDEATALLDELEAEERAEVEAEQRSDLPQKTPEVKASGNAAAAIEFALAQLGDAYVYGGMGPDVWDCSGLTMGAWGAAGVALPHSSSAQSAMGTAVSLDQIQPGDLVFYYSPISHVGLYIGDGLLVHAANPSTPVEIIGVTQMPISAIRRVG